MPHTITKEAFYFDELSDKAKDKAREWFRESMGQDEWWDVCYEDFQRIAEILGITFDHRTYTTANGRTGSEVCIFFSGFWSQGDGACFEGTYEYAKGCAKKIRQYAPEDTKLHAIADLLAGQQKIDGYKLTATVKSIDHHYCHPRTTSIEVFKRDDEVREGAVEGIAEALRDFMHWMYDSLEKEWEWRNSDEQVDESIRANEYEFDADGDRLR